MAKLKINNIVEFIKHFVKTSEVTLNGVKQYGHTPALILIKAPKTTIKLTPV